MNELSATRYIADENAMRVFGGELMRAICRSASSQGITLYLNGKLGAGKTTLSRGMIQSLGFRGKVKSPTYALVEEYHLHDKHIYHFDLYRLNDPEELEFMGIRDYFGADTLCLVEWADRGGGLLPQADIAVNITYADNARYIRLSACSETGKTIILQLENQ